MAKYSKLEAHECLASLQMIGEGWWRNANLALNMGAHLALNMTPREFVLSIGRQQTLDATDQILEMKREGVSVRRIATITGISPDKANMILAGWRGKDNDLADPIIEITPAIQRQLDTGLAEPDGAARTAARRADRAGHAGSDGETPGSDGDTALVMPVLDAVVVDTASYESQIAAMSGQITELTQEVKVQQQKVRESSRKNHEMVKQAHIDAAAHYLTDEKREELREAAKKQLDGEQAELLQGLSSITLRGILSSLEHAQDQIQELRRDGHLDSSAWSKISSAMGNLSEEVAIARATLA